MKDLDEWIEAMEVREAVRVGKEQIARGEGMAHEEFVRRMRREFDDRTVHP